VSTVEEHGGGRQLIRVRVWPRFSWFAVTVIFLFVCLSVLAARDDALVACTALGSIAALLLIRSLRECGTAIHSVRRVVEDGLQNDS
jgi:hypothetical protein